MGLAETPQLAPGHKYIGGTTAPRSSERGSSQPEPSPSALGCAAVHAQQFAFALQQLGNAGCILLAPTENTEQSMRNFARHTVTWLRLPTLA